MWVHPDIVESQQWTTVMSKKSRGKAMTSSSNVVSISTREIEEDVASLTSSGDEESTLVADTGIPPASKTRSGKHYLKQYGEPVANSPQPAKEAIEQRTRPSVKKQKDLRYVKTLPKSGARPSTPFCFNVLAQLANIPARITLYKLLRLSKFTRDALREALDHASKQLPCITFT